MVSISVQPKHEDDFRLTKKIKLSIPTQSFGIRVKMHTNHEASVGSIQSKSRLIGGLPMRIYIPVLLHKGGQRALYENMIELWW